MAAMHAVSYHIPQLQFTLYLPRAIRVNPYPSWANREVMLLLTGYLTGITTNAILGVYNKGILLCH